MLLSVPGVLPGVTEVEQLMKLVSVPKPTTTSPLLIGRSISSETLPVQLSNPTKLLFVQVALPPR